MMLPSANRSRQIGLLLILVTAIGWGLNWPIVKVVLRDWPPLFARGVAGSAAAFGLALAAAARGQSLAVSRGVIVPLCAAAALNVFAWMGFSTMAMVWLSVSEAALLVYTMPIWAMLLAWPVRGARPSLRGIGALMLGMAGLAVLFGGAGLPVASERWPGVVLALAAAILFALGTVTLRSPLPLPPISLTAWQVGLGCLPMVVLGLLFEQPDPGALTATGWAALVYMTVVPMGICYLSWFAALRRLPPTTASMATLLTPVIGVVGAAFALGEPLGMKEVLALGLTLSGVAIALRRE
jgi:drug/metabolite transporter (DMT)-like permease